MRVYIHSLWFWLIMCFHQAVFAANPLLSLELNNAELSNTIYVLAKLLHLNVVLDPNITGKVTLHLKQAAPDPALNLLLTSYDLVKIPFGNIWWITPRQALIRHKQNELQWQKLKAASAPRLVKVWQIKYGNAQELAHLIKSGFLSKRGEIHAEVRTNTLCIQDIPENIAAVGHLIKRLDVPTSQVLIEARLASVDRDCERELGISFAVNRVLSEHKEVETGTRVFLGHYSLAMVRLADRSLLDVKLAALEKAGLAQLISRPSLFTASQQPAWIEAGEEVPYQEVSESGGTAVVFKKAVLGLKVTPQVLPGNKVLLRLQINQDRPSNKLVLGVPTISTRQMMTQILVQSGQTIVLGGVYESNHEKTEQRLPFLSRLPLIGMLFKQEMIRKNKRELLIFVTPKIIT